MYLIKYVKDETYDYFEDLDEALEAIESYCDEEGELDEVELYDCVLLEVKRKLFVVDEEESDE